MSALAQLLVRDASNVTGIADRVGAGGLVKRQSAGQDRRIKVLALTVAGTDFRERCTN